VSFNLNVYVLELYLNSKSDARMNHNLQMDCDIYDINEVVYVKYILYSHNLVKPPLFGCLHSHETEDNLISCFHNY